MMATGERIVPGGKIAKGEEVSKRFFQLIRMTEFEFTEEQKIFREMVRDFTKGAIKSMVRCIDEVE